MQENKIRHGLHSREALRGAIHLGGFKTISTAVLGDHRRMGPHHQEPIFLGYTDLWTFVDHDADPEHTTAQALMTPPAMGQNWP